MSLHISNGRINACATTSNSAKLESVGNLSDRRRNNLPSSKADKDVDSLDRSIRSRSSSASRAADRAHLESPPPVKPTAPPRDPTQHRRRRSHNESVNQFINGYFNSSQQSLSTCFNSVTTSNGRSSNQQQSPAVTAQLQHELQLEFFEQRMKKKEEAGSNNATVVPVKPKSTVSTAKLKHGGHICQANILGSAALEKIKSHKSTIAALRPMRRKIKWNSVLTDACLTRNASSTKISELNLNDLELHGGTKALAAASEFSATANGLVNTSNKLISSNTFTENGDDNAEANQMSVSGNSKTNILNDALEHPGRHLDLWESKISHCCKLIERVQRQSTDAKEQAEVLRKENLLMRRQILMQASTPSPALTASSSRLYANSQAQGNAATAARLREKLDQLDEQIGMLKMQKRNLEADTTVLREIVDESIAEKTRVKSKTQNIADDSRRQKTDHVMEDKQFEQESNTSSRSWIDEDEDDDNSDVRDLLNMDSANWDLIDDFGVPNQPADAYLTVLDTSATIKPRSGLPPLPPKKRTAGMTPAAA